MGEFALTQQVLQSALRHTAEWVGDHDIFAAHVDAAARTRDRDALQQLTPRAEETARRYEHRLYLGIAHRAWGVLHRIEGRYPEAVDRLAQARGLFAELGAGWQLGRTIHCLGELASDMGDFVEAEAMFEKASDLFEEIQAARELQSSTDSLRRIRDIKI